MQLDSVNLRFHDTGLSMTTACVHAFLRHLESTAGQRKEMKGIQVLRNEWHILQYIYIQYISLPLLKVFKLILLTLCRPCKEAIAYNLDAPL